MAAQFWSFSNFNYSGLFCIIIAVSQCNLKCISPWSNYTWVIDSPSRPYRFAGVLRSWPSLQNQVRLQREKHRASMATMVINSVRLSGFHANISTQCSLKVEEGRGRERERTAEGERKRHKEQKWEWERAIWLAEGTEFIHMKKASCEKHNIPVCWFII